MAFLEVDHIDRVFPLANGGEYIALKNIDLTIRQGEFVTLLGHSGCGKSTLLNIVAGLDQATQGGVILEGRQVTQPGPDRMVVFQNYSLLPWLTVRENIALAVNRVMRQLPAAERQEIVQHHIDLVKLGPAADKKPGQLSGGMKQRVAIARALAIRPRLLLLDEPFGALDALTRSGLQDQLMQIAQESDLTCIMVTHDVDEALLLSDRIVMLTNGPEAHVGQIMDVPFPRPRERMEVVGHAVYYALRNEVVYFLNRQKQDKKRKVKQIKTAIAGNGLEKVNLEIGFVPLTDCIPLVIAKEKGFFQKHGLEQVTLSREPSWKAIAEGVSTGRLDAAQMVAGMPIALTLGINGTPQPTTTALIMSRNGNAITFGKPLLHEGVRNLEDFKAFLARSSDTVHTLASVHPASMHNLLLRYWLASGGIDPDQDVSLVTIPPPQMVTTLKAGSIDGYCTGEPWNSRAVQEGVGYVIATDLELWAGHPEKVLGVQEAWANQYPQTHLALVKAVLEACEYCDDRRNREEMVELLARPEYVGAAPEHIRPGLLTAYDRGAGIEPEMLLRYNQFYVDKANCPDRVEGLWLMTQLARWDIVPFPRNWLEILDRVRRVDVFGQAARELGLMDMEPNRNHIKLFDGAFNPDDPINYLKNLPIKRNLRIEEMTIDPRTPTTV